MHHGNQHCFVHVIIFIMQCGLPNENNWHAGENNRGNFQEMQNRIIGKIKSTLGSDLPVSERFGHSSYGS